MATVSKKQKKATHKPPKSRPVSTSIISQPVAADSASLAALSSLSSDGKYFALLSLAVDKHRLRVFDTETGRAICEYILQVSSATFLEWGKLASGEGSPEVRSKKRKRATQDEESNAEKEMTTVILLGLGNGSIILFSPTQGRPILSLQSTSSAAILATVMDPDGVRLWASSTDGYVRLWNTQTNSVVGSWTSGGNLPYCALALRPGELRREETSRQLLVAHHSIELVDFSIESLSNSKAKPLVSFPGHTTNVKSIQWIPSSIPVQFVTNAERDRFVEGWRLPTSGSAGSVSFSAPVDGDVRKVQVSSDGKLLLVLSATGGIYIFTIPSDRGSSSTISLDPQSAIGITVLRGKDAVESIEILDAAFISGSPGEIQVARLMNGARPVFQTIRFTDEKGDILPIVKIKVPSSSLESSEEPSILSKRYRESANVSIGSGLAMDKDGDVLDAAEAGNLDTEMAELTLGQRLKAMNGGENVLSSSSDSDSDPTKAKRKKKKGDNSIIEVPTESLSRTLIQALHSSDAKLLEGCLRHSDINLIQNTVRRIPPQLAIPLLQACVDRLGRGRGGNMGRMRGSAASAQRGTVMVAWIKTVLLIHSGHLMTIPNLVSRLSSLHNTLTKRLALQERLLLLNGRLDLALSQIELRSSRGLSTAGAGVSKGNKNKEKHVTRYVEGESSDDEGMEVEIEKGSDAGSVEDIRLDDSSEEASGTDESDVLVEDENENLGTGTEEEDEDEEEAEEEDEDDDEDDDDDSEASDRGPRTNGLIDDEAEESWGSEGDEEEEEY